MDIFERHEMKFLLSPRQYRSLQHALSGKVYPDEHGESTICNVYYDTPDYLLIRRSLEGGIYKEKLRMRSYGPAYGKDTVFLELKKKYDGIVYKRRIALPLAEAEAYMDGRIDMPCECQIGREIDWFCRLYNNLLPAVHLSYERSAYYACEDPQLRLTFDRNILWQTHDRSLSALPCGQSLLGAGQSLLEIKTATAIPIWLVKILEAAGIQKTSFSKYGMAYTDMLMNNRMRGVFCA